MEDPVSEKSARFSLMRPSYRDFWISSSSPFDFIDKQTLSSSEQQSLILPSRRQILSQQ